VTILVALVVISEPASLSLTLLASVGISEVLSYTVHVIWLDGRKYSNVMDSRVLHASLRFQPIHANRVTRMFA